LLVIDPPWYNKSARRGKKYQFLSCDDLLQLPLRSLASCHPCGYVFVWVTNNPIYQKFIIEELFPAHNISYYGTWYWLKVTDSGEFVVPLCVTRAKHRRPYEPIIIGYYNGTCKKCNHHSASSCSCPLHSKNSHRTDNTPLNKRKLSDSKLDGTQSTETGYLPRHKVICSVPPKMHSRKPMLFDLVQDCLKREILGIELFAQSLHPNVLSWGNNVLLYQQLQDFAKSEWTSPVLF